MTSPGMEYGDNTVAARLSIDVPTESISQLRELTQEIERFRTSAESGARGAESFGRYLEEVASAGQRAAEMQRELVSALERSLEMQARAMASPQNVGSSITQHGAPAGYTAPFAATGPGTGSDRIATTVPQVAAQYEQLRQTPREFLNMQAAHGGVPTGAVSSVSLSPASIQELANKIAERDKAHTDEQGKHPQPASPGGGGGSGGGGGTDPLDRFSGNVGNVQGLMNSLVHEFGGGGTIPGMMGATGGALANIGSMLNKKNPNLGSTLKGVGTAGLIGAGLFEANNRLGETIQGYRNVGSTIGQGAGTGFGLEMQAQAMAMSPFLTTAQAREIVQGGLTLGMKPGSQQWDNVMQFMQTNLKQMNVDIAEQVGVLRTNVQMGGESMGDVGRAWRTIFEGSKEGYMTSPQMRRIQEDIGSQLAQTGETTGANQVTAGVIGATTFKDNPQLAGTWGSLIAAGGDDSQTAFQSFVLQQAGELGTKDGVSVMDLYTGNVLNKMTPDGWNDALYKMIDRQANSSNETPQLLAKRLRDMFPAIKQAFPDPNQLITLIEMARKKSKTGVGTRLDDKNQQQKDLRAKTQQTEIDRHKPDTGFGLDVDLPFFGHSGIRFGGRDAPFTWYTGGTAHASYDDVMKTFGSDDVIWMDENGKEVKINPNDQDQMGKVRAGIYKWKRSTDSGEGISLQDTPTGEGGEHWQKGTKLDKDFSTDEPGIVTNKDGSGNTTLVALTEDAKRLLQLLPPSVSPSKAGANEGAAGAAANSPGPGN